MTAPRKPKIIRIDTLAWEKFVFGPGYERQVIGKKLPPHQEKVYGYLQQGKTNQETADLMGLNLTHIIDTRNAIRLNGWRILGE